MKRFFLASSLSLTLLACQTEPSSLNTSAPENPIHRNALSPTVPVRSYPALSKASASGSLRLDNNTLILTLNLPELPEPLDAQAFATQKLDLSTTTKLFAQVSDSHGKTYAPNGADGDGAVNYTGGTITLTFNNLTPDELLFVDVQAKNGTTPIPQADLATVIKHTTDASPVSATLNFQTAVAAKALKAMLPTHATQARSIDLTTLNTLTASITGVTGTAPNLTYSQNHPSLVNTALLATHLQSQAPNTLTASNYRQSGATVNLTVSGLAGSDKVQVQITDAASAVRTNLGNGSTNITSVTPGSGLTAIVTPFGTPSQTYNYSINPTNLSLTEGNTTNLTVTATPTMTLTNISPAAGPAGTLVTITGTGFTGATAVNVNGSPAASFTVNSDTQITATVPVTATDGTISVTKGATTKYSTDFDVYRRIYVNDDASGNNNGSTWTNAYNSLQTALTAAGANDEIWVAAGTYKPTSGVDRSATFSMKTNVHLYGGFNGTETAKSQRNIALNETILSGDLNNNDTYGTTPAGNTNDNVYQVVSVASKSQVVVDGFVLQGGMASGLKINNGNCTFENMTFRHNQHVNYGGAIFIFNSSQLTLKNTAFLNNFAPKASAIRADPSGSIVLAENLVFKGNKDTTNGSAIVEIQGVTDNATWRNIIFAENNSAGRGFYGNLYDPANGSHTFTLQNILLANNTLQQSALAFIGSNTINFAAHNVTLANNSCIDRESGFCQSSSPPTNTTMNNWLYWKDNAILSGTGSNNINLGSGGTPFIDSTDPDGPDNIFFTADDGYNLAAGNAGIDAGNTNAGVPDKDIVGRDRVGATDAGAYEYEAPALPANVIVVDKDASGTNNGTSWANAYTSLQSALSAATAGKEIWVAEGTYTPHASDRTVSFQMKDNVNIYGGFVGNETVRSARDAYTHVVKLSGDLNGNDNYSIAPFGNIAENSYTVLRGANNAILDGVTVEGGNSDGPIVAGDPPDIVGGGMINNAQSPTLNQVIFTHNTAVTRGGAMYNTGVSAPIMTQVIFANNRGSQGGAIFNLDGSPKMTQCAFIENVASSSGGGMYTRTEIGTVGNANPVLKNVIFSGNTALGNGGGGMYSGNSATPELINVTFSNNTAGTDGGGYYDVISSTTTSIKNVLFWNSSQRTNVVPPDGSVEAASDPFINASNVAGPDGRYFTSDDGLRISPSATSVLNAGTNVGAPITDILGNPRPDISNANAEPGAYEYSP